VSTPTSPFAEGVRRALARIVELPKEDPVVARAIENGDIEGTLDALLAHRDVQHFLDRSELRRLVAVLANGDASALAGAPLRGTGLPGVPGRSLVTLVTDADVDAMRDLLEPGQVWMRVDQLDNIRRQWPMLDSAARAQRREIGLPSEKGGRPVGRLGMPSPEEQAFFASLTPDMRPSEIYRRGVAAGVWVDDGRSAYDRRNRARVRSLLRRAGVEK
jgi:hypothetical protein